MISSPTCGRHDCQYNKNKVVLALLINRQMLQMTTLKFSTSEYPRIQKHHSYIEHFFTLEKEYTDIKKGTCITPLTHLGLLTVAGSDAKTFLQGQITCDLNQLTNGKTLFGAYCDRKGRVLSNFHLCHYDESYGLILPKSMLTATRDALTKYAIMSKVTIEIASRIELLGLTTPKPPTSKHVLFTATIPHNRSIVAIKEEHTQASWDQLTQSLSPIGCTTWKYLDIMSHLAYVTPENSLKFLPQMLGLSKLDAISFDKGCYLGQEIIARAQHRGKVKKQLHKINLEQELNIGDCADEHPGSTVISITATETGWTALVVTQSS